MPKVNQTSDPNIIMTSNTLIAVSPLPSKAKTCWRRCSDLPDFPIPTPVPVTEVQSAQGSFFEQINYSVSSFEDVENKENNNEKLDAQDLDSLRSGESVIKNYLFDNTKCNANTRKCIEFWKTLKQRPDLKPCPCEFVITERKEQICGQDIDESSSEESFGANITWYDALLELQRRKMDQVAFAATFQNCKICDRDEPYEKFKRKMGQDYSDSELRDYEDLTSLNTWVSRSLKKEREEEEARRRREEEEALRLLYLSRCHCNKKKCTCDLKPSVDYGKYGEEEIGEMSLAYSAANDFGMGDSSRVNSRKSLEKSENALEGEKKDYKLELVFHSSEAAGENSLIDDDNAVAIEAKDQNVVDRCLYCGLQECVCDKSPKKGLSKRRKASSLKNQEEKTKDLSIETIRDISDEVLKDDCDCTTCEAPECGGSDKPAVLTSHETTTSPQYPPDHVCNGCDLLGCTCQFCQPLNQIVCEEEQKSVEESVEESVESIMENEEVKSSSSHIIYPNLVTGFQLRQKPSDTPSEKIHSKYKPGSCFECGILGCVCDRCQPSKPVVEKSEPCAAEVKAKGYKQRKSITAPENFNKFLEVCDACGINCKCWENKVDNAKQYLEDLKLLVKKEKRTKSRACGTRDSKESVTTTTSPKGCIICGHKDCSCKTTRDSKFFTTIEFGTKQRQTTITSILQEQERPKTEDSKISVEEALESETTESDHDNAMFKLQTLGLRRREEPIIKDCKNKFLVTPEQKAQAILQKTNVNLVMEKDAYGVPHVTRYPDRRRIPKPPEPEEESQEEKVSDSEEELVYDLEPWFCTEKSTIGEEESEVTYGRLL